MILFDKDKKIYYSTLVNDEKFFSGFGTKLIGDGKKIQIIFDFLNKNNINYKKVVIPEQIHSANVSLVDNKNENLIIRISDTDGIITFHDNLFLTVVTADCLPILFVEKKLGILGISHQGWRGSIKKLVIKMIEKIIFLGGKKENIVVSIGPGIGQCCYIISEDRYYQFLEEFNGYSKEIFIKKKGNIHLDLSKLNYLMLIEAGIKKENIDFFPFCTYCQKELFFSFRRYKEKKDQFGEMLSFIIKN